MLGWMFRMVVFKFLPRRIVPILTFVEIVRLLYGFRRRRYAVNDPRDSRTSPPPSWPGSPRIR